ncbi:hypothetical protein GCM10009865_38470 [Aeromicrobium ponti]|nr:hypothetical protein [Cytobacillus oceanisediminis]
MAVDFREWKGTYRMQQNAVVVWLDITEPTLGGLAISVRNMYNDRFNGQIIKMDENNRQMLFYIDYPYGRDIFNAYILDAMTNQPRIHIAGTFMSTDGKTYGWFATKV